VLNRYI